MWPLLEQCQYFYLVPPYFELQKQLPHDFTHLSYLWFLEKLYKVEPFAYTNTHTHTYIYFIYLWFKQDGCSLDGDAISVFFFNLLLM